jgi:hypothetical protein
MTTLLTYALSTLPQPLQASPVPPQGGGTAAYNAGTLTLVVTNPTGAAVPLAFLELTIPVGDLATDLTAAANASACSIPQKLDSQRGRA